MSITATRPVCLVPCLILVLGVVPRIVAQSLTPDAPEGNPGRPTVSTPATLTPTGYLQFETGVLDANHSPEFSSRLGLNEVVKLTVAPRLQFIASSEPLVHYRAEGITANGTAEVFLGAQAMLFQGEGAKPTISISYFRRVYDGGAPEIDIGSSRNSVTLLASADVKGFHYDANALFNEQTGGAVSRASSARHSRFHIAWPVSFCFPVKSGTLPSHSFGAMRWETSGP